jgi:predicted RNase H-like nuclease
LGVFPKHSNKKEDNTVGITANLSKANIQVYPNPATAQLFVKTSELAQRISLYNVIGQNVKNIEQPALQNRISLEGIPAGVYLLTVQENDKVYSYKVMKR